DPVALNSRLGLYTNFLNLLDMAGIAVPVGLSASGLPFGVTLTGPAFSEEKLAAIAALISAALNVTPGSPKTAAQNGTLQDGTFQIAVVGAHMQDLPLNHELTSRGGRFLERTRTAVGYRLYALAGGPPHRPGLVRGEDGAAIEL